MLKIASFDVEVEKIDQESPLAAQAIDFAVLDSDDLYRVASLLDAFATEFDKDGLAKEAVLIGQFMKKIAANVDNFWQKPEAKTKQKVEPWREGLGPIGQAFNTRYSPDLPGVSLARVSDGVFKDPITGKTYDFNRGFVLDDGTEYVGGSVAGQTPKPGSEKMQPLRQQIKI